MEDMFVVLRDYIEDNFPRDPKKFELVVKYENLLKSQTFKMS